MRRSTSIHVGIAIGLLATAGLVNCGTDAPPAREGARRAATLNSSATLELPTKWWTTAQRSSIEPTSALDSSGRLWTAYLEVKSTQAGEQVSLIASVQEPDGRMVTIRVEPNSSRAPAAPSLCSFNDQVYLVWEADHGEERGLFARALGGGQGGFELGSKKVIATGRVLFPTVQETSDGILEVVYQALAGEQYEIRHARRGIDGSWSSPTRLFEARGDYWRPRSATRGDGALHVVCDSFDGDRFVVDYALLENEELPVVIRVAETAGYQGMPSLALDSHGRTWVAWEEADQFGEIGGLRAERRLKLAAIEGTQIFNVPGSALRPGGNRLTRADFPRVACGPNGLLLTTRTTGESFVPKHAKEYSEFYTSWFTQVLSFDAKGRAQLGVLRATDGDGEATEQLLASRSGDKILCVFSADGRSRQQPKPAAFEAPIETDWRVGKVELPAPSGFPELVPRQKQTPPYAPATHRPTKRAPGERALFGDLHRHTQLSRCQGTLDGTSLDAYRYARGPGQLDFISITDHYQHLTALSHWRTLRDVERFYAPGSLVTFPGVERALRERAHVNEIYLDPVEVPGSIDSFHREPDVKGSVPIEHTVAIPHMMGMKAAPFPWKYFRSDLHRVMEVYQGLRGSYEGAGLPYEAMNRELDSSSMSEGIRRGLHFGFIASSDHRASSTAYAGVWATELTRESVFEALRARRTFGATSQFAADLKLGSLAMGARGSASAEDPLWIRVQSPAPIATIEVIKNGETLEFIQGEGPTELVAISCRRYQALGTEPPDELKVSLKGGRILKATERMHGRTGATLALDSGTVSLRKKIPWIDFVLEIEPTPSESGGPVLELQLGDLRDSVPLNEIPAGRSIKHAKNLVRESIWRIGKPFLPAVTLSGFEIAIEDPNRAAGDSYYARITFTDGNVVWTSPIRVTSLE